MNSNLRKFLAVSSVLAVAGLSGCGSSNSSTAPGVEDNSASGAAAGAVGGALSGSSSGGTQAYLMPKGTRSFASSVRSALDFFPDALAAVACPNFKTTGSGCSASAGTMWLSYSGCVFGGSATWTGTQALIMSAGTATCGSFPNPGANGTLTRQFTSSATTTPGQVTIASALGTTGYIDDATADLANFDTGQHFTTIANNGYGVQVSFGSNGARSGITIGHHIYATNVFDHSVTGSVTITETPGSASRTISGSLSVYHNLVKVIGTSTFNNVTHTDGCCFPTSGSITTSFGPGKYVTTPTTAGAKLVGKSETLTFTGCGTGTLVGADGTSQSVTLTRCF